MSEFKHTNPIIDYLSKIDSLSKIDGVSVNYPETNTIKINEEFLQDGQKIPDQLRFRDETLVNAVAALEAKADSDEPHILGAEMKALEREQKEIELLNTRPKNITEIERNVENMTQKLEIVQQDIQEYSDFLGKMAERAKMLRALLSAKNTTPL